MSCKCKKELKKTTDLLKEVCRMVDRASGHVKFASDILNSNPELQQ